MQGAGGSALHAALGALVSRVLMSPGAGGGQPQVNVLIAAGASPPPHELTSWGRACRLGYPLYEPCLRLWR